MKNLLISILIFCSLNIFGQGTITKIVNDTVTNEIVLTGAFINPVRIKKDAFSHTQSDTSTLSIYLKNSTKYSVKWWQLSAPVTTSNDSLAKILGVFTKIPVYVVVLGDSVDVILPGGLSTSTLQQTQIEKLLDIIDSLGAGNSLTRIFIDSVNSLLVLQNTISTNTANLVSFAQSESDSSATQRNTLREIKANQTNKTQFTKITDGTNTVPVQESGDPVSIFAMSVSTNLIKGVGIDVNKGNSTVGTQRITIANDDTLLTAIKDTGSTIAQELRIANAKLTSGIIVSTGGDSLLIRSPWFSAMYSKLGIIADSSYSRSFMNIGNFPTAFIANAGTNLNTSNLLTKDSSTYYFSSALNAKIPTLTLSGSNLLTQNNVLASDSGKYRSLFWIGNTTLASTQSGNWTNRISNGQYGLKINLDSSINTQATVTPATSGGLTTYHLVSAATTNATNIKASAGQVYGYFIYNSNAAARKVVFHNTAGTPTAGASVFFSLVIPASSGANVEFTNGIAFSTGIAITTVTGLADSDATAVGVNDLNMNIFFK